MSFPALRMHKSSDEDAAEGHYSVMQRVGHIVDVCLANILLSLTSSMDSRGQLTTELALLTSFSVFLSLSALPRAQQTMPYSMPEAPAVCRMPE